MVSGEAVVGGGSRYAFAAAINTTVKKTQDLIVISQRRRGTSVIANTGGVSNRQLQSLYKGTKHRILHLGTLVFNRLII